MRCRWHQREPGRGLQERTRGQWSMKIGQGLMQSVSWLQNSSWLWVEMGYGGHGPGRETNREIGSVFSASAWHWLSSGKRSWRPGLSQWQRVLEKSGLAWETSVSHLLSPIVCYRESKDDSDRAGAWPPMRAPPCLACPLVLLVPLSPQKFMSTDPAP